MSRWYVEIVEYTDNKIKLYIADSPRSIVLLYENDICVKRYYLFQLHHVSINETNFMSLNVLGTCITK